MGKRARAGAELQLLKFIFQFWWPTWMEENNGIGQHYHIADNVVGPYCESTTRVSLLQAAKVYSLDNLIQRPLHFHPSSSFSLLFLSMIKKMTPDINPPRSHIPHFIILATSSAYRTTNLFIHTAIMPTLCNKSLFHCLSSYEFLDENPEHLGQFTPVVRLSFLGRTNKMEKSFIA
jgi:hypothetical protein